MKFVKAGSEFYFVEDEGGKRTGSCVLNDRTHRICDEWVVRVGFQSVYRYSSDLCKG